MDLLCFCSVLCLLCLCARLFICALWSPAGKGLTSWLSFVVSTVSLLLSHWYPGSGVVLDCCRFLIFTPLLTFSKPSLGKLRVYYTNADSLLNKISELEVLIGIGSLIL